MTADATPPARPRALVRSVTAKLLLAVSGVVLLAIALQAWVDVRGVARADAEAETRNLLLLHQSYLDDVRALDREAAALAMALADRPGVGELAGASDRPRLLAALEPVFRQLQASAGVVHLYVHRPDGYVLLRVHDPARFGDQVGAYRRALTDAARSGEVVSGVELDPNRLGVRGVAPVRRDGRTVALVEVGLDDDEAFLTQLRTRNGADYHVWLGYDAAAPTGLWPRTQQQASPSRRLFHYAATRLDLPHPPEQDYLTALGGEPVVRFLGAPGAEVAVLLAPLRGYGGETLGVLEITASRAEALARLRRERLFAMGLAGALGAVALGLLALAIRGLVLRPLRHLTRVARRWSEGDRAARSTLSTRDELQVLGLAFNALADRVDELLRGMEREVAASRAAEQAAHRELTERQRLEEQLRQAQKMEAVGRLAGGVAHDFNNLLTVISGNLDLAQEELVEDHPVRAYLSDLRAATESAAALTGQLLAFSRRQLVQPEAVPVNALVERTSKLLRRTLGEDVALVLDLAPDAGTVLADPGQLEQVLVNLGVNARDAMPAGGTLTVRTRPLRLADGDPALPSPLPPGRYLELTVSDDGEGMSEEVRLKVFEPFFTTKPKGRGTGLGLATVFGAVSQAGGAIQVESAPGRGATFRILLPAAEAAEARVRPAAPAAPVAGGAETVLLVEDEAMVRELAQRLLRGLGYRVLVASSGAEALALLTRTQDPIRLLFTDLVMPGMNGRELAERVVALRPSVKVLYTSGYAEEVLATHGVVDPRVRLIPKPYTLQALASKVREALDGA